MKARRPVDSPTRPDIRLQPILNADHRFRLLAKREESIYALLLGETLRPGVTEALHRFRLQDEQRRSLVAHGGIWLVELSKVTVETVHTEQERWLKFFVEGERLDEAQLPEWMQTVEMQQAMSTLQGFSEQERAYHRYQARQDYLRQQKSIENYMKAIRAEVEQARAAEERERAEKEQARAAEERERAEKETALAEIERLKALLQSKG